MMIRIKILLSTLKIYSNHFHISIVTNKPTIEEQNELWNSLEAPSQMDLPIKSFKIPLTLTEITSKKTLGFDLIVGKVL